MNNSTVQNKSKLVRETCNWVFQKSTNIQIDENKLLALTQKFHYTPFNQFSHHVLEVQSLKNEQKEKDQQILLYLFVLDSLNFCFWPLEGFQYENLAANVKRYIQNSNSLSKISQITEEQLVTQIFSGIKVPLASERARILRQVSEILISDFNGSICNLVTVCNKSCVKMLSLLTRHFPNFQDHSIYKGHQIHFYKRSQILIADIHAKFEGKSYGQFYDIQQLTMFPDYRVPQILNWCGVLRYNEDLQKKIQEKQIIQSGSQQQIQIRAASVVAVERMKRVLALKGRKVNSIQVDWFLWEEGQISLKKGITNHHRTMTIYY